MTLRLPVVLLSMLVAVLVPVRAASAACHGVVYDDRNGNGRQDAGEHGLPGVHVGNGAQLATTDRRGGYALDLVAGDLPFVIKPPGYDVPRRADGLPGHWQRSHDGACPSFALRAAAARRRDVLDVLVFADPQPKSMVDVGYFERDIVEPILAGRTRGPAADLGLSLGDIVSDDPSLYAGVVRATTRLGAPWLHVPGNHDIDVEAVDDDHSLGRYRERFGPETYAWEEREAVFIALDDVIAMPGRKPAYVGGLREDQFAFLERYLATVDPGRLVVLAVHIPLFPDGGRETFRSADRERLFRLLERRSRVLVLSGHSHAQQHVRHDASTGWHGDTPLHEYNVGAACGAYWSGVKDAAGIPDATMADGTPNGYARLHVAPNGDYRLAWFPARTDDRDPASNRAMRVHAPRVLRRGAYPAWGVFANVYMGQADTRVEFRVDDGPWRPMARVERADPWLVAQNVRDDEATALRGYDRSPEPQPSTHLWRGALPTDLSTGTHRVEIRAFDPWTGERHGATQYELQDAPP